MTKGSMAYEVIARQAVPAMADVLVDYLQRRDR